MAKKRERGATFDSNRQRNRVESSTQVEQSSDAPTIDRRGGGRRLIVAFILIFVVSPAITVLVYNRINLSSPSQNPNQQPNVLRKGLVKADVNWREILTDNNEVSENSSQRHFTNPVLAYVTPWNSAGYDLANRFASKLTHVSPVWYDLKSQGSKIVLEGRHNADIGWISELRRRGNTKVLPRFVIEVLPKDLLKKKKLMDKVIGLILTECKDMDYDGIVLESWSRWAAHGILHDATMRNTALLFIKRLAEALHNVESKSGIDKYLQLVYVIGPPRSEKLQEYDFKPEDLQTLGESVDGFSLMTYDFSSPYNPGPNAPLQWIRSTLQLLLGSARNLLARKIFVGINFYGYDYLLAEGGDAQAVIGRDYLAILKEHAPSIRWEKKSAEHYFLYTDHQHRQHAVFYPSLMSISERLKEARSWGSSLSIWEIGQGLDYFFDLL